MKTVKNISKKLFEKGVKNSNLITGISKLPKEEREFCIPRLEKIQSKISFFTKKEDETLRKKKQKELATSFKMSLKKYILLQEKCRKIMDNFHSDYKMGENKIIYIKGYKGCFYHEDCTSQYNGDTYKAKHGSVILEFTKKTLQEIQIIGGVPTIITKKRKISECKILKHEGKKYNKVFYWEDSFLTKSFHCNSLRQAKLWRREELLRVINQRNYLKVEKINKKRFVGFSHSLKSGNCEIGTKMFCDRHNLNPEFGYSIEYILSLEDTVFTRRLFIN